MVKVKPRRYVVRSQSGMGTLPGVSHAVLLDLYLVEGAIAAFDAFRDSWLVDDRYYPRACPLPGDGFTGTEVRGEPAEVARWTAAQQAALTELRDAETELLHDHGLSETRHDTGRTLGGAPGWGGRMRRLGSRGRSEQAFQRYLARVARAAEAYRPVRDEIAARVREAEQRARERWDRIQAVAARPWWSYRVDERFGVVWVSHEEGSALDTPALAEKLMEVRRETGITKLHWKPGVRPEVERSSGADFETWWRAVVPRFWTGSHTIPETRVDRHGRTVHISAHTSFTGIDSSFGGIHT
jgi:hypothetical protein